LIAFDSDDENVITFLIEVGHAGGNVVTLNEVVNFVETDFGKCLTYGWVRSFLVRSVNHVSRAVVSPQEKTCRELPRMVLGNYLAPPEQYVPLVPT
jgi:hypothetical protein